MSAREDLYAAVMSGGPHSPDRSEKASALIDAFAHELAEEIRGQLSNVGAMAARPLWKQGYTAGLFMSIALIDPEVS